MSTTRILVHANDGWANEAKPSANYADTRGLALRDGAGQRAWAYIFFNRPFRRGVTIMSATLRVHTKGSWGVAPTLTVQRLVAMPKVARLNWNNKPGISGAGVTKSQASAADGDLWEIDVTQIMQTVSNGAEWYGLRITTDDTTGLRRLYSSDAGRERMRPTLEITWSEAPQPPTDLAPAGGRSVSVDKPTVSFTFDDRVGSTTLQAVRVQVDATGNWAAPAFDSGWVDTDVPELDLATTAYAGLANGAETRWRAQVKDTAGLESAWSDVARFRRDPKGALAIVNPSAAAPYVTEWTPPIIWTLTGETQKAYRVIVTPADDPADVIHDTGRVNSTETSYTLPAAVIEDDAEYQVVVRIWDSKDRVANGTDKPWTQAVQTFTFNEDPTPNPVTGLAVESLSPRPHMRLTFSRATAPDQFALKRDGKFVDLYDAADLLVSAGNYALDDRESAPFSNHTWVVQAVENGKTSANNPSVTAETRASGAWLIDPERDIEVFITGKKPITWSMGERSTVLEPLGSEEAVLKTQALRGWNGSCAGRLANVLDVSAAEWRDRLLQIRAHPGTKLILVNGDKSIRVRAWNIVAAPSSDIPGQKDASFEFEQVDVRRSSIPRTRL